MGPGARLEAYVDSPLNNGPGRCSYGGFLLHLGHGHDDRHSAPLLWSCSLPKHVTTASGASELHQIARCTQAILGLRIFIRDLNMPQVIAAPTPMFTDSQVVLDGAECRRASRESKWISVRYALVRTALDDKAVDPLKCPAETNDADCLTKSLCGPSFDRAQERVMG